MSNLVNISRPSPAQISDPPQPWWRPWAPWAGAVAAASLAGAAVVYFLGPPDLGPLNDIALTDTSASFNLENLPQWLFFSTDGMELYYLIGASGLAGLTTLLAIKRALRPKPDKPVAAPRQAALPQVEHKIGDKAEDRRFHGGPIRN